MRGNLIYWLVLALAALGAGYAVYKHPSDWWLALIAFGAVAWLLRSDPMKKGGSVHTLKREEAPKRVQVVVQDLAQGQALYRDGLGLSVELIQGPSSASYQFEITDIGARYQWALLHATVLEQLAKTNDGRLAFSLKDSSGNIVRLLG